MPQTGRSILETNLAGLTLRNPLVLAAGTCGYVDEMSDVLDLKRIGAVVTKSITHQPRRGNPPERIVGLPTGMLNAIGLANVGLDAFIRTKVPHHKPGSTRLIGSIAGHSIDDYIAVAAAFDQQNAIDAVELNVSCPNTSDGLVFGDDPRALTDLLNAVRPALQSKPLIVKLSPNAGSIVTMAATAIDAGADALTLVNTIPGMAIDVATRKPRISRGIGGYSGPGLHPIAVRMVHEVYRQVAREANVPIIGLGGVMGWNDAAEFILAGATAVGMGTALYADPRRAIHVVEGLEQWVKSQRCASVHELIGALEM